MGRKSWNTIHGHGHDHDHTDIVYRDAVSKLRSLLASRPSSSRTVDTLSLAIHSKKELKKSGAKSHGEQEQIMESSILQRQDPFPAPGSGTNENEGNIMTYIEKQRDYINQLETETTFYRQELTNVVGYIEEIVAENEVLQKEHAKKETVELLQTPAGRGDEFVSNYNLNARAEELEAQLVQAKRSLRLAQEEVLALRKETKEPIHSRINYAKLPLCQVHIAEIEAITKEKHELAQTVKSLEELVNDYKKREIEATQQVRTSLELVEQLKFEKEQAESDAKQSNSEISRLHSRLRQVLSAQTHKIIEGKVQGEKSCKSELEHLKSELSREFEVSTKIKLELEAQKRVEIELKNDINHKMRIIDDLRSEMQLKISALENQLSQTTMRKTKAETDLANVYVQAEKLERNWKQESVRLSTELKITRDRAEEAESDLRKCGEVLLKLQAQTLELKKDAEIQRKLAQERSLVANEEIIQTTAEAIEERYALQKQDLEEVIRKQNTIMDKLKSECHALAQKLEESAALYKLQKDKFEKELKRNSHLEMLAQRKSAELEQKLQFYVLAHEQLTNRLYLLEGDEKAHAQKTAALLTKQHSMMLENEKLLRELALLNTKANCKCHSDE